MGNDCKSSIATIASFPVLASQFLDVTYANFSRVCSSAFRRSVLCRIIEVFGLHTEAHNADLEACFYMQHIVRVGSRRNEVARFHL